MTLARRARVRSQTRVIEVPAKGHRHVLADVLDAGVLAGRDAVRLVEVEDAGTAAAADRREFASAAQGERADTAVQPEQVKAVEAFLAHLSEREEDLAKDPATKVLSDAVRASEGKEPRPDPPVEPVDEGIR